MKPFLSILAAAILFTGCAVQTVTIGKQTWKINNANVMMESGAYCLKQETHTNEPCAENMMVYNWDGARKVCPEGFHLPTLKEWKELDEARKVHVEDPEDHSVAYYLCDGGNIFSGGFCYSQLSSLFWTADEQDSNNAYTWDAEFDYSHLQPNAANKTEYLAVRCIKD